MVRALTTQVKRRFDRSQVSVSEEFGEGNSFLKVVGGRFDILLDKYTCWYYYQFVMIPKL